MSILVSVEAAWPGLSADKVALFETTETVMSFRSILDVTLQSGHIQPQDVVVVLAPGVFMEPLSLLKLKDRCASDSSGVDDELVRFIFCLTVAYEMCCIMACFVSMQLLLSSRSSTQWGAVRNVPKITRFASFAACGAALPRLLVCSCPGVVSRSVALSPVQC